MLGEQALDPHCSDTEPPESPASHRAAPGQTHARNAPPAARGKSLAGSTLTPAGREGVPEDQKLLLAPAFVIFDLRAGDCTGECEKQRVRASSFPS